MSDANALEEFANWVVSLDAPGNAQRRVITLPDIVDRAQTALRESTEGVQPPIGAGLFATTTKDR